MNASERRQTLLAGIIKYLTILADLFESKDDKGSDSKR
jgi:hypothetical protein